MTDWSEEMAAKLKRRNENRVVRNAKALEKQARIQHDGPAVWQAVKSDVLMQAHALNADMGNDVIVQRTSMGDELTLEADLEDGPRSVYVRFYPHDGALTWITGKGYTARLELNVGQDGRLTFYDGMVPNRTGSIAKQILETLLD